MSIAVAHSYDLNKNRPIFFNVTLNLLAVFLSHGNHPVPLSIMAVSLCTHFFYYSS